MNFSKKVVADVKKRLDEIASEVQTALDELEVPSDGLDAEQTLTNLDGLRMSTRRVLEIWMDEQHRVFPASK
jgi:hypothetical protein